MLQKEIFSFLDDLKENNNRDWMQEQKKRYQANEKELKAFYQETMNQLNQFDEIEKLKVFRINRDLRFSKNKIPYNTHRSASFSRLGKQKRGGYYLRIERGESLMAGGFFAPEPIDLLRIRKEFELDASEIREIIEEKNFKKAFGGFNQEYKVKTAPKGFNKEDENIDLIRLKSFFVEHKFTDEEVLAPDFQDNVIYHYQLLIPFFDYMSDVLTTDLNGESII